MAGTTEAVAHALLELYVPGTRCWFPDKDAGWISGQVTAKNVTGDNISLSFLDEKDMVRSIHPNEPSSPPRSHAPPPSVHPGLLRQLRATWEQLPEAPKSNSWYLSVVILARRAQLRPAGNQRRSRRGETPHLLTGLERTRPSPDQIQLDSFTTDAPKTSPASPMAQLANLASPQASTVTTTFTALSNASAASPTDVLPPLRNPPLLEATEDLTNLSHLNEPAGTPSHHVRFPPGPVG